MRKPFQGIGNIIRFNWHFFVLSLLFVSLLFLIKPYFKEEIQVIITITGLSILIVNSISLAISWYIYDYSNLYSLAWLDAIIPIAPTKMLNIHAGFDETSLLLQQKYPHTEMIVLDFYDPKKHTEISIQRARKAYPPYPNTQSVTTDLLPLESDSIEQIFVVFSAHEIRNDRERILFFQELKRILTENGQIIVTEHLRDKANFTHIKPG
jgi:SAM-dependent methyltransferase